MPARTNLSYEKLKVGDAVVNMSQSFNDQQENLQFSLCIRFNLVNNRGQLHTLSFSLVLALDGLNL